MKRRHVYVGLIALAVLSTGAGGGGVDPRIIGTLALILVIARMMGYLFGLVNQPAVLGELLAGVILGNLNLFGINTFEFIATDHSFELLAEIGVILLLFEVGLESDLVQMARAGVASTLVAIVGVVVPVGLGYGVHAMVAGDASWITHLFVGAVLAATSVGITARVLQGLGKIDTGTGRVILGAAVIDDVLGLVILAVLVGMVDPTQNTSIAVTAGMALGFLALAVGLGRPVSRLLFRWATALRVKGFLLALSLSFCFVMAYTAKLVGLHFIIGAFAAGLVLDAVIYRDLENVETHGLEDLIHHLSQFLVPVFFVVTGTKVDLSALGNADALILAGLLSVVAIIGKQACSLVAYGPGVNKLAVGLGMIPRGEVGLIFANVGKDNGLLSDSTFAAAIVMVMVTTMVTPPVLAWVLQREDRSD